MPPPGSKRRRIGEPEARPGSPGAQDFAEPSPPAADDPTAMKPGAGLAAAMAGMDQAALDVAQPPGAKRSGNARTRADSTPPLRGPRNRALPRVPELGERAAEERSGGEGWQEFLERSSSWLPSGSPEAVALFETFRTTPHLALVFATFASLFSLAAGKAEREEGSDRSVGSHADTVPWAGGAQMQGAWQFPYESIRVLLAGNWKAKRLWEKLDTRCTRADYASRACGETSRLRDQLVVVVGAGPCGLRLAIELTMLGARVTVVERRQEFTRLNQLHLWSWCGEEIKDLGARCLEPPSANFGTNPDLLHCGIAELQTLLLKTALLLGVEVFLGASFVDARCQEGGWSVDLCPAEEAGASPGAPTELRNVAVLIGSDGPASRVSHVAGIRASEVGSLRNEEAIGLVCNFATLGGSSKGGEGSLRSFALARQFFPTVFKELARATGADLENIVYTKGDKSHYFVMTPSRRSLVDAGVIRDALAKPLMARENICHEALDALVRRVVAFRIKPGETPLAEVAGGVDALTYADHGPQLFDFSKLRRASEGLVFVQCTGSDADAEPSGGAAQPLLVGLVGDALLEPFWPEGLGIVRGFLSALDMASAVALWAGGGGEEEVSTYFASAYTQLKTLASATRRAVLMPEEKSYALPPSTRYRSLSAAPATSK